MFTQFHTHVNESLIKRVVLTQLVFRKFGLYQAIDLSELLLEMTQLLRKSRTKIITKTASLVMNYTTSP